MDKNKIIEQLYFESSLLSGAMQTTSPSFFLMPISTELLRRMIDWAGNKKALSMGELNYIIDYAFGLKEFKLFHETNIRRHLDILIKKGFKV